MELKNYIREIMDFPEVWIWFKDISPALSNPEVFNYIVDKLWEFCKDSDKIVWLDARWFFLAWAVAYKLKKPLILVRKKWKLPWETISVDYELEYWKNTFQMQVWSIKSWDKVSIIDDLLATWGTSLAACDLVKKQWWIVNNVNFVIDLTFLPWSKNLSNFEVNSLVKY